MITASVQPNAVGWSYAIFDDGCLIVRQEFHPSKAGNVPMTEAEAQGLAQAVVDRVSTGAFVDPGPLDKTDFLRLFTPQEVLVLLAAAETNPEVKLYQFKLAQARVVLLSDPDIQAGVPMLEAAGFIGPGRAAQILRNQPP